MISEKPIERREVTPNILVEPVGAVDCCSPVAAPSPSPERLHVVTSQVKLLAALADNTRLGIVEMLAQSEEPVCVCDILPRFELGQPTISHHLKVLRDARLVLWERRGLWVYYSLNRETLERATEYMQGLLTLSQHLPVPTP